MADRVIVLYDEECGLCTWLGRWLDEQDRVAAAPIGSQTGDRHLRDLPRRTRYESMHVVDAAGRRFSGADGLPPLLRALPAMRWAAALADALPWAVAGGYELLSRHRHRLSTLLRLERCGVPERRATLRAPRPTAGSDGHAAT